MKDKSALSELHCVLVGTYEAAKRKVVAAMNFIVTGDTVVCGLSTDFVMRKIRCLS